MLDALPSWFGISDSNDAYGRFVEQHPTWSAVDENGTVVGVLAPRRHTESCEIELLAVMPGWHRRGVGRALVAAFEADAAAGGHRLTHVKTLGPSHPDGGYAATRRFYESVGYLHLEEMPDLWPGNPALIMVKPLPLPAPEARVISATSAPVTQQAIVAALRAAGVCAGATIIVHSSLSRVGWVAGGAQAVVQALVDVVGEGGTIVMPALSSDLSEPSRWVNPPVPESWWPVIRNQRPVYDVALTPPTYVGAVVDCFRHLPGVLRSAHPADSFVAWGPLATQIVDSHPLSPAFGDGSPLSRLYDLDARIVLFGVGHGNNTSLHLAEDRAQWAGKPSIEYGAPVMVGDRREWVTYADIDYDSDDFEALGADFAAATGAETRVPLGYGEVISCSMRAIVDFAVEWLPANRQVRTPGTGAEPGG